jgi:hypothetical protein
LVCDIGCRQPSKLEEQNHGVWNRVGSTQIIH